MAGSRQSIARAALGAGLLACCAWLSPVAGSGPEVPATLEALGERLFFDANLSWSRSQSCASCHDPGTAFSDPGGMASLGGDGVSLGDRNAPTAMYAAAVPPLSRNAAGGWVGGLFHDGRAASLAEQAAGPPLNPAEMAMPSAAAVAGRLAEDAAYRAAFPALFGDGVLDDPARAYAALSEAIAAFERTAAFQPFSSRYDRWLRGEIALTAEEELGRVLFFSQQFTNCSLCHRGLGPTDPAETFTDHRHHNIGVPLNAALRAVNGVQGADPGLGGVVDDPAALGRFRTPTLRNVAVTGPYMHNGVFADLRTVVLFYNQYNTRSDARRINPETGLPFGAPEVAANLAVAELTHGPALDDRRIDALVAFLRALTDERYEHLLAP